MSRLILVRHGQARAFEDHSDRLSELGILQARLLGRYLHDQGLEIHEVRTGSLERQVHTAQLIGDAFVGWPEPAVDPRWNEYDATGVLRHLAPQFATADESFARLAAAATQHRHTAEANRHFQRMFEVLMNRWTAGEIDHPSVEPWATFRTRAESAIRNILSAGGESRNILVVSSGGPIATAVQLVLEAPPRHALELNWRMRNSSITEFLFSRGRVTLDQFNAVPHLNKEQTSYR
jgi:broad specificity phosphatase PhoE